MIVFYGQLDGNGGRQIQGSYGVDRVNTKTYEALKLETKNERTIKLNNMDGIEACSCEGISTQKSVVSVSQKSIIPSCIDTRYRDTQNQMKRQ